MRELLNTCIHILTINCSEYLLMDGMFQLMSLYLEQHRETQTQRWNSSLSLELTQIMDTRCHIVHMHLLWMEHIPSPEGDQPVLQHLEQLV